MRRSLFATLAFSILSLLFSGPFLTASGSAHSNAPDRGCAAATPVPTGADASPVELEHGNALLWGSGEHGLLLLHGAVYDAASWEDQATVLANHGFSVLAMEELAPDAVQDGIAYLMKTCGVSGFTVIGASAGGSAALKVLADKPEGITGLILLSATGDVDALGEYPKLFVASAGEGFEQRLESMANDAPGDQNQTLILPGSAHAQAIFPTDQGEPLVNAILAFLDDTVDWDNPS